MTENVDSFAALRNPFVRAYALARLLAFGSYVILSVAVGWFLYERTHSAWSLGLVGIFELAPVLLLMVVAGNTADRYPRRNIVVCASLASVVASAGLAVVAWTNAPVSLIYVMLVLVGTARAFSSPSFGSILPQLLKPEQFVNANAWVTSAGQAAAVAGPALGGLIIAMTGGAGWAFVTVGFCQLMVAAALMRLPAIPPPPKSAGAPTANAPSEVFAGFGFIKRNPLFLSAITLDLFVMLLSGTVALLPIYAKDILQVGPAGLGWLRAAPSVGSLVMALLVTRLPPWQRPGRTMLYAMAGFGLATIVFGFSKSMALSMFCLFLTGVFDTVGVVVRVTLEQVITPDHLRGRVSAINYVFIGFSNEFGMMRAGSTGALFGPVAAVVGGGVGSLIVVAVVCTIWPQLARVGPLHTLQAAEDDTTAASPQPASSSA
jgi:MFS family permease